MAIIILKILIQLLRGEVVWEKVLILLELWKWLKNIIKEKTIRKRKLFGRGQMKIANNIIVESLKVMKIIKKNN